MQNSTVTPPHLSEEAKAIYVRIVGGYDFDDVMTLILTSALEAFDTMRDAQRIIAEEGLIIKDRFEQPKAHPAVAVERDAKTSMLRNLKSLGLDLEPLQV